MDKRLYPKVMIGVFIVAIAALSLLYLVYIIDAKKGHVLDKNLTDLTGDVAGEGYPIRIEAVEKVPVNGVFAAQIYYKNINNSSYMRIKGYPGNMTWIVELQKEKGRTGVVFPVEGPGYIVAEFDGYDGYDGYDDGRGEAKAGYEIVPGEQNLTSFIIESWALMHIEITRSLSPGDRAAVVVDDINRSFTIIVTENDIEVVEGAVNPDIVFNIYKSNDLWEFVGTDDLGKTIKEMVADKKMSIQLKTGNLAKLSRYTKMARKLGVI